MCIIVALTSNSRDWRHICTDVQNFKGLSHSTSQSTIRTVNKEIVRGSRYNMSAKLLLRQAGLPCTTYQPCLSIHRQDRRRRLVRLVVDELEVLSELDDVLGALISSLCLSSDRDSKGTSMIAGSSWSTNSPVWSSCRSSWEGFSMVEGGEPSKEVEIDVPRHSQG